MNLRIKPVVLNYCGYKVEVVEIIEQFFDPKRGYLVRARVRYPDGFIARALLRPDEVRGEEA